MLLQTGLGITPKVRSLFMCSNMVITLDIFTDYRIHMFLKSFPLNFNRFHKEYLIVEPSSRRYRLHQTCSTQFGSKASTLCRHDR